MISYPKKIGSGTPWRFLTKPDGTVIPDAFVWDNYLDAIGMDAKKIFQVFDQLEYWGDKEEIKLDFKQIKMVRGSHPALKYRGNKTKREKYWLQTNLESGLLRYGYTGWQWAVSFATGDIKHVPIIQELMKRSNALIKNKECSFNHCIGTLYKTGQDYIGMHSDKVRDFQENSWFLVIKFGYTRLFEFCMKDESKTKIFSEKLVAGTGIWVRANSANAANSLVTHGVPIMEHAGKSGSIVFRCIKTRIKWSDVEKKNNSSKKTKQKALMNKILNANNF